MKNFRDLSGEDTPFMKQGLTVDEICALWRRSKKNNEQITVIAELCGTTRGEVRDLLVQYGYLVPTRDAAKRSYNNKDLEELYGEEYGALVERATEMALTLTMEEAQKVLGVGRRNLYKMARKHGIVFRTVEERNRIKRDAMAARCKELGEVHGMTAHEIARELGVTKETIWKLAQRYKFGYKHTQKGRKSTNGDANT